MISKSHFWWGPLRDPHETYLRLLGAATPRPRSVAPQLVAESHRKCTDRGCLVVGTTTAVADFLLDYTHSPLVCTWANAMSSCAVPCALKTRSYALNAHVPPMLVSPQSSCASISLCPQWSCALNPPVPSILLPSMLLCPQSPRGPNAPVPSMLRIQVCSISNLSQVVPGSNPGVVFLFCYGLAEIS
jgi:hypothetical protein